MFSSFNCWTYSSRVSCLEACSEVQAMLGTTWKKRRRDCMTWGWRLRGTATKTTGFSVLENPFSPWFSPAKHGTFRTLTFPSNFVPLCAHGMLIWRLNGSFQMTLTLHFTDRETEAQKRERIGLRSQSHWWDDEDWVELFLCLPCWWSLNWAFLEGLGRKSPAECEWHVIPSTFCAQIRCLFLNVQMEVLPQMSTFPRALIRKQLNVSILLFAQFSRQEKSHGSDTGILKPVRDRLGAQDLQKST